MLFPKDNPNPSEQPPHQQPQQGYAPPYQQAPQYPPQSQPIYVQAPNPGGGGGAKIPILFGAVLALVGACVYLFYQLNEVKSDLASTRESLSSEISKMYETSTVTTQTSRRSIDKLDKDVQAARAAAAQLSGQAKVDAEKHAEELAAKLTRAQEEQGKQIAAVGTEVKEVKTESAATAAATTAKIDGVNSEVGNVKTDLAKNKADTEKLIASMKTAQGDLGVQSGLIATNSKELQALRELGERNYTEFKITKSKKPQKVGDVLILLKSVDAKRNKYTIELTADDKMTEKKDRSLNEPIQFLLSRARQPYELVVNDIKKDLIAGYVSSPKVQTPRSGGSN
jgi:hypothetical protein